MALTTVVQHDLQDVPCHLVNSQRDIEQSGVSKQTVESLWILHYLLFRLNDKAPGPSMQFMMFYSSSQCKTVLPNVKNTLCL